MLKAAAAGWCVVAVVGQLMFAGYVAVFYGRAVADGQTSRWNQTLPSGLVPGDTLGNGVVASHLLFAVLIIVGGAIQLLPQVRRRAPALHRWNGRVYLFSAVVMSLGGLFIVGTRQGVGDTSQHLAICVNALLILTFAALAGRDAVARRFDSHRRWALRLYLAVAGVWFFRIGLMAWLVLNRGPAGFDPRSFQGPFLTFLAFAQYLLPLSVLEIYFRVRAQAGSRGRLAMAAGLGVITLLTALGIGAAAMLMWLPRLR
ncbi:DUF2306 domain-containing protein [Ideonella azotifigens]|uniref:DUF2306 domain-containing protein n=1 Tax=Ideonella azotifigens TaxID=513160 RepID=A0ABP3VF06_9BURK